MQLHNTRVIKFFHDLYLSLDVFGVSWIDDGVIVEAFQGIVDAIVGDFENFREGSLPEQMRLQIASFHAFPHVDKSI